VTVHSLAFGFCVGVVFRNASGWPANVRECIHLVIVNLGAHVPDRQLHPD
jgi:hypothetical protein